MRSGRSATHLDKTMKANKPVYKPRPIASNFAKMTEAEFDAWLHEILNPIFYRTMSAAEERASGLGAWIG